MRAAGAQHVLRGVRFQDGIWERAAEVEFKEAYANTS